MNTGVIRSVAALSGRYEREFLATWVAKKDQYRTDWLSALDFFLGHVFFQGRRDALSERYYLQTMGVLRDFFSLDPDEQRQRLDEAWNSSWIPHDQDWSGVIKDGNSLLGALAAAKAGKQRDLEMVLDTLRYIRGLPEWNVVTFSLDEVTSGRIGEHYEALRQIRQVGPKTASFYLRDLCSVYKLKTAGDGLLATQPIDTWVRTISKEVGIIDGTETQGVAKTKILSECERVGVSPADYNAGAWYLGTHSLEVALEGLGLVTPKH